MHKVKYPHCLAFCMNGHWIKLPYGMCWKRTAHNLMYIISSVLYSSFKIVTKGPQICSGCSSDRCDCTFYFLSREAQEVDSTLNEP